MTDISFNPGDAKTRVDYSKKKCIHKETLRSILVDFLKLKNDKRLKIFLEYIVRTGPPNEEPQGFLASLTILEQKIDLSDEKLIEMDLKHRNKTEWDRAKRLKPEWLRESEKLDE